MENFEEKKKDTSKNKPSNMSVKNKFEDDGIGK
jgi:hypothetical protein